MGKPWEIKLSTFNKISGVYAHIYIPKQANIDESFTEENGFKVVSKKQGIQLGEKVTIRINYNLHQDFLESGKYKFKFIKQSGVKDETLSESFIVPTQYEFTPQKDILVRDHVCTRNFQPDRDSDLTLQIKQSEFGPRIISHELIDPITAQIKFNQPIEQNNITVRCFNKETKHEHKVLHTAWLANNTILDIKISSIPHEEEKFYILELTNLEKKPRKVSIVYRSKYFRTPKTSEQSLDEIINENYNIGDIKGITSPHKGVSFQVSIVETENDKYILRQFPKTQINIERIKIIEELLKNNFSTPSIISTKTDKTTHAEKSSYIVLNKFIRGNHPAVNDKEIMHSAKLLAQFHNITEGKKFPHNNGQNDYEWIVNKITENFKEIEKVYGPEFRQDYDLMIQFAKKPQNSNSIRGIAHHDFKTDNIIIGEDRTHYLIDMFNMQEEDLICDVGKYLKSDGKRLNNFDEFNHSINLFLKEYFKLRPHMEKDADQLKEWGKYWAATMFFFFICKYDKDIFSFDIIKKAKQGIKNIHFIDKLDVRF